MVDGTILYALSSDSWFPNLVPGGYLPVRRGAIDRPLERALGLSWDRVH